MPSPDFKQVLKEASTLFKEGNFTRKKVTAYEFAIKKELPQICEKCGRVENLTLDHIVPLLILNQLGIDTEREIVEGNYRILCRICNQFKSGKLDFSTLKTKEILIKIIERI